VFNVTNKKFALELKRLRNTAISERDIDHVTCLDIIIRFDKLV